MSWLEHTYGSGKASDVLERLARHFWESAKTVEAYKSGGRGASGLELIGWGRQVGIKEVVRPRLKRGLGYLTPCVGGFRLSFSGLRGTGVAYERSVRRILEASPRHRWVFAHELGHTFFFDHSCDPPERTYGRDKEGEESLCQRFAAELLLPRDRITKEAGQNGEPSIDVLMSLARMYGVPLTAAARRLIQDLGIMHATCVIVSRRMVQSWSKWRLSRRPLPKSGVEIWSPRGPGFEVTEELLRSDELVGRVCRTGCYSSSDEDGQPTCGFEFVEGLMLRKIAPVGACMFLFHKSRPTFGGTTLFSMSR